MANESLHLLTKSNYQHQIIVRGDCEFHTVSDSLFSLSENLIPDSFKYSKHLANTLLDQFPDKICLCLSGGLDSQAMLSAFASTGRLFRVFVLKFNGNLNQHDIEFALDLCALYRIKPDVVSVDVVSFFESGEYYDIAIKAHTNSPMFALHAWFSSQINGVPVFSGQPWTLYPNRNLCLLPLKNSLKMPSKIYGMYIPCLKEYSTKFYLEARGQDCVSHFFEHERNLLQSFWLNRYWINDHRNDENVTAGYMHKYLSYINSGFPLLEPHRMAKLTGFERVHIYFKNKYNSVDPFYFNELFRKPLEAHFPKRTSVYIQSISSSTIKSLPYQQGAV